MVYRDVGGQGGYYYRDSVGNWVLYSIMLSSLADRNRYLYQRGYDPTGEYYVRRYPTTRSTTYYHRERRSRGGGWGWFWIAFFILVIIIIIAVVIYVRNKRKQQEEMATAARLQKHRTRAEKNEMRTFDKMSPQFWSQIRPRDIVTLKDEQTLTLLMESRRLGYTMGADVRVKAVREITEQHGRMKWHLYELEPVEIDGELSPWHLLVKVVDDAFDVRVMFMPPSFHAGDRGYLVDEGMNFIFSPPENPEYFDVAELEFAHEIDYTLDDGDDVVYKQKPQGILFGEMYEQPRPTGVRQPQFVSIMEYSAQQECPNPELMIVEMGDPSVDSYVVLLQGTNVNIHDVDVMPS